MLILHDAHHLPEAYAARLLAGFLGVTLDLRPLDIFPGRENESEAFLALSPLGRLPVLEAGDTVLADWQAILAHLAQGHGPAWWPGHDPALIGWLGLARDLAASLGAARLHEGFGVPTDIEAARARGVALLRPVERHLWFAEKAGQMWLMPGDQPSVADIACFVFIALCEEGGISRMDTPTIRRWCDRLRHWPGFVPMSGVFAPMAAPAEAGA